MSEPEDAAMAPYDDSVFDTASAWAACGFLANAQGGARPIADGVYIVAAGSPSDGVGRLELIDARGGFKDLPYPAALVKRVSLYDPFARVVAATTAASAAGGDAIVDK